MKGLKDMNSCAKLALLGGALALGAGPAAAVDYYLAAKPFTKSLPMSGGTTTSVPMWGYVEDTGDGAVAHCYDITGAGSGAARLACVNALPDPVARLSRSGHCLFVNRAYERWFGVRAVDVVGRLQREVLDAANAAAMEPAEPLRRVRAGETVQFEAPLHSTDDGLHHTLVTLVPDRDADADGSSSGHFAVVTDISERLQSEARLRAAQDELEAVLAALPDLLFEVALDGRIHRFHSPRSDLLYMPPEHFLGRLVSEVLPPSALEPVQAALAQAHREGYSNGQQYALDLPQGRRCFELSVALKALDPAEGPRLVVLARDVTERNQAAAERLCLERQLRESQKQASIDTMAGGVARDFNDIVAAILGHVALLREDLARDHPAQHELGQVQRAGLLARTLVQQILALSRRQPQDARSQPLPPLVEATPELQRVAVPAGRGQHVLYVGDDQVMAALVERLLQRDGYTPWTCRTAQQALELVCAQPRRCDLLVTDFELPGLSGLELFRQVAALCPGLPCIISSDHVSAELRAQALREGVLCVMHKENTADELPALLHTLLAVEGTAADR